MTKNIQLLHDSSLRKFVPSFGNESESCIQGVSKESLMNENIFNKINLFGQINIYKICILFYKVVIFFVSET